MSSAPIHAREAERIACIRACRVLEMPLDPSLDRIAQLAAEVCRCPISHVTFVDGERQWVRGGTGAGTEIPREQSFCAHAIAQGDTLVIQDTTLDARFANNPLVLSAPKIRFYAGVPLCTRAGLPLGALCVIDVVARSLTADQRSALTALAREVEIQLELRTALGDALRSTSEREQTAAMIVHDMRNSLVTVLAGATCLDMEGARMSDASRAILRDVIRAANTLQRMTRDILDVSRAEVSGVEVHRARFDARTALGFVARAAAQRAAASGHAFATQVDLLDGEVDSDPDLLRRIVENLLENAFKYAPAGTTARLSAERTSAGALRVAVADEGPGVPADQRERIFDPGVRLGAGVAEGWGFGLRFCKLAVEALGGTISVRANSPRGSVFVVDLPGASQAH
jgi:signal transduction histidine kinase